MPRAIITVANQLVKRHALRHGRASCATPAVCCLRSDNRASAAFARVLAVADSRMSWPTSAPPVAGRIGDAFARSFWVLADAGGTAVCVCTWRGRTGLGGGFQGQRRQAAQSDQADRNRLLRAPIPHDVRHLARLQCSAGRAPVPRAPTPATGSGSQIVTTNADPRRVLAGIQKRCGRHAAAPTDQVAGSVR